MSANAVTSAVLAEAVAAAGSRLVGDDRPVNDLFHDSRDVTSGSGFVAIRGATTDGHEHVGSACAS